MPPGRGSSMTSEPFHCAMRAGSTKKENTTSGLALMRISRTTGSLALVTIVPPALFRLGGEGQAFEPARPELVEEFPQPRQRFRSRLVQATIAVTTLANQARCLQHLEMLRDRRPRHREVRGYLA